ncbi:putative membrane protein [Chthoniobacter flavus]|uniref:glutamine amidotransferase n=1 Tax=Chthoniobacter flavus TaxID=191863 RepID=UPI001045678A|nr:glutamine amidotransferase [Chthoniobacter flavus]TCO95483.1 putative membrane protein [Chthoniobacter flavus]
MLQVAALYLAGREWLWPAVAVGAVALCCVVWSYLRTPASHLLRIACAALKLVGTAILLVCLLDPMWSSERAKPGANVIAVVADNSLSMTLHDRNAAESRGDALRRVLTGDRNLWLTRLGEDFEVRDYLADTRLLPSQNFRELSFDGRGTALGHTLEQLIEHHHGQPLAGVILLTDGIAADPANMEKLRQLPPLYPVIFSRSAPSRDLAITNSTVTQTSFEDAPVTIQADIAAIGFSGEEIVGQLIPIEAGKKEADEKPIATETAIVPANSEKIALHFQIRPAKPGVLFYRLKIAPKRPAAPEITLANNESVITVDRGSGPYRVLYASGRPNWEYKFLHRAVESDDQTQLVGLIRIANREPKFTFRGREGESSNPLFRGFGNQSKEDIERYDQPVFTRLNTVDEFELRGGFPKTPEELFRYRAIILDDLEAEFFTQDQMSLLQRFVSERGGGLLMLGGMEAFRDGKYSRTAIGDMLPVYLDTKPENIPEGRVHLSLTREGWLQPWARLRANEADERQRLAALPEFAVLNRVGTAKPAATVVATVSDGHHDHPALVTQRFGRGRTAAMLIGDFWVSGLGDEKRQTDLLKGWRQIVRWLVADIPDPIEVRAEPQPDGSSVQLLVRARDAKFQPLDNASVTLKVSRPEAPAGEAPLILHAEPSASEPGLYEASFIPRESGGYRVDATVAIETGAAAGQSATGWTSDLAAAEFRDLKPNRPLMERLAKQTGGRVLSPEDLTSFARELPSQHAPVTETWTRPIWHTPLVFLLALACLVGEWGLRRWKGLA